QDQGRDANRRENVAHVHVHRHPVNRQCSARAGAIAHHVHEPIPETLVVGRGRVAPGEHLVEVLAVPPARLELREISTPFLFRPSPRVVLAPHGLRVRIEQNERGDSFRIGRANAEFPGRGGKPERDRRLVRAWRTLTSETSAMSGSTSPWRRRLHPSGPLTTGKRMLAPRATY